jgi:hypothetical protein
MEFEAFWRRVADVKYGVKYGSLFCVGGGGGGGWVLMLLRVLMG